jgi:hypothetical protein
VIAKKSGKPVPVDPMAKRNAKVSLFFFILFVILFPVLGIRNRIRKIHMFLGLPDPDPLVRGTDPDLIVPFSQMC